MVQEMEGDLDFTDGGIEGPAGFNISRNAVKAIVNGGKVSVIVNLKPGVPMEEFRPRVEKLWEEVRNDPRSNKRRSATWPGSFSASSCLGSSPRPS